MKILFLIPIACLVSTLSFSAPEINNTGLEQAKSRDLQSVINNGKVDSRGDGSSPGIGVNKPPEVNNETTVGKDTGNGVGYGAGNGGGGGS